MNTKNKKTKKPSNSKAILQIPQPKLPPMPANSIVPILSQKMHPLGIGLQAAASAFVQHNQNQGSSYDYTTKINATVCSFVAGFTPTASLLAVTPTDIDSFLQGTGMFADAHGPWGAGTKQTSLAQIGAFFAWALPTFGFHTAANPAKLIHLPAVWNNGLHPLDPKEAQSLMDSAWDYRHGLFLPRCLLGTWAALRPQELDRLEPKHLDLANGDVLPECNLKVRRVKLAPMTVAILRALQDRGALLPESFRPSAHAWHRILSAAGLGVKRMRPYLLRKTGIQYYYEHCRNVFQTAQWAGIQCPQRLQSNPSYFSAAQVATFWNMKPRALVDL